MILDNLLLIIILACIPYNIYIWYGWHKRTRPVERSEVYWNIAIVILFIFAFVYLGTSEYPVE